MVSEREVLDTGDISIDYGLFLGFSESFKNFPEGLDLPSCNS